MLVLGIAGTESHRCRDVEQQVRAQVRLLLEVLDRVAVAAREGAPVEQAQVVARTVLAVLGEDHARAAVRAAMDAGAQAFDRVARAHAQVRDALHDLLAEHRWCPRRTAC